MKAVIIRTDNSVEEIETGGKYHDIKDIIKGWIEHISIIKEGEVVGSMYVNEEGKLLDLPYNRIATSLYLAERWWVDGIVGDALVFGPGDGEGGESDVTEEVIDMIKFYSEGVK